MGAKTSGYNLVRNRIFFIVSKVSVRKIFLYYKGENSHFAVKKADWSNINQAVKPIYWNQVKW